MTADDDPYLDLLKGVLTGRVGGSPYEALLPHGAGRRRVTRIIERLLRPRGLALVRESPRERIERAARHGGHPAPGALTMVGERRLDDLEWCVRDVVARGVPGDLVEAGVWRGGVVIFLRALLNRLGADDRMVWAADTFSGLPSTDEVPHPDDGPLADRPGAYAASRAEVEANLATFGLLDEGVGFLPGAFRETLPDAPIEQLALIRLDADLHHSTQDALTALYPRLSPGGWCVVDDYGSFAGCRRAVDDYRTAHDIHDELVWVDTTQVRWQHHGP